MSGPDAAQMKCIHLNGRLMHCLKYLREIIMRDMKPTGTVEQHLAVAACFLQTHLQEASS